MAAGSLAARLRAGETLISGWSAIPEPLVAEAVALLEPQARQKGLALTSVVPEGLPPLISDSEKCRHIHLQPRPCCQRRFPRRP